jgi:THUMP domain-like/Methyltransferase domain
VCCGPVVPSSRCRDDLRRCWHSLCASARRNTNTLWHSVHTSANAPGPTPPPRPSPARSRVRQAHNGAVTRGPGSPDNPVLDALLSPEGRDLVESLMPYDAATAMTGLSRVRSDPLWAGRAAVVAAAATQARLRTRASARFPGPGRWWTPDGLEQATRPVVAARHARRFVHAGVQVVADLGCGVGSDALAIAAAGPQVLAVDLDPDALWALSATAADLGLDVTATRGDVRTTRGPWNDPTPAPGLGCFVDPARRSGGSRSLSPESWSPPWSWVRSLARRVPTTGAKVAPGIDHGALPAGTQTEWISVGGDLVEAGVWWGPLREGTAARRATVLAPGGGADWRHPEPPAEESLDDMGGIPAPEVGPVSVWLVEPDPAVIRAGLVSVLAGRLGGHLLDPRIAYIACDTEPPAGRLGSTFAVLDEVPFGRKPMRAWLRTRGYGDVIVKKRGINVVPEELRGALRLTGDGPTATLVLTRTDAGPLALLVERASVRSAAELQEARRTTGEEPAEQPGPRR